MPQSKRLTYHLEVCPGDGLQAPTDDEIRASIKNLPGGVPSFVILTKKKNHFMQAGGSASDGFQLEYEEFSMDGLWEHEDSGDVKEEIVIKALISYANDTDHWREDIPWKRLTRSESKKKNEKAIEQHLESLPKESSFKALLKGVVQYAKEEIFGKPLK